MSNKTRKKQNNNLHKNLRNKLLTFILVLFTQSQIMAYPEPLRTITCSSIMDIIKAIDNVRPGDEIIITKGTYTHLEKYTIKKHITLAPRFYSKVNGTAKHPIVIRGEKASARPILQGPSNKYDGYVFLLEGDHWIIKDLKLKGGSKGLILDNANNVIINNVEVYDIASEGIHIRDGSSNTLIKNCFLHDLGIKKAGNGEGIYIGSDAKEHSGNFNPFCHYTTIRDCKFGPNITAEAIDVKEEVDGVKIYDNTFTAKGIVGDSRNDSFIDVKGINTYIYNNTFNVDNAGINAGIDVIQKKPKKDQNPIKKTGYKVAVFKNTFNLGSNSSKIPIIRFKGGKPFDIHMWDNNRKNNSIEPVSFFSDNIINSCPSWSTVSCNGTGNNNPTPTNPTPTNPTPNPNSSNCSFGTPQNNSLSTLKIKYKTISIIGKDGPDANNLTKFAINWNASKNGLYTFAFSTKNGKPTYYVDLKKSSNTLDKPNPDITISNSGISGLDGSYWITTKGNDFILVSKSGKFSIYCSNNTSKPSCKEAKSATKTATYTLSPNPASETLHISGISEAKMTASIYDMQGKRILQEVVRKEKNSINVSALKAGTYIITVIGSEFYESQLISIK